MRTDIEYFFSIALTLEVAHFFADWTPFSTPWMLNAKKFGRPLIPIWSHAGTHVWLMACGLFGLHLTGMPLGIVRAIIAINLQLYSHFLIDVSKGWLAWHWPLFRDAEKRPYWVVMGFDQLLHHVVILVMILILCGD